MPLLKKSSVALLAMLLACCQKVDLAAYSDSPDGISAEATGEAVNVVGTGEGSAAYPFTVEDIRSMPLSASSPVWVIGYLVGTAPSSMSNATFLSESQNQTNILLSSDSLCTDTARCIPVELSSDKWRKTLSLPTNTLHFRKCLLVQGTPSRYLYNRKGLRGVSAGLWLDGFDIASVAPQDWNTIEIRN